MSGVFKVTIGAGDLPSAPFGGDKGKARSWLRENRAEIEASLRGVVLDAIREKLGVEPGEATIDMVNHGSETAGQGIRVRFCAEIWVNDVAHSVAPEGEDEWIIGLDEISDRDVDFMGDLTITDDTAMSSRRVPDWAADWSGPFSIEIAEAAPFSVALAFWKEQRTTIAARVLRHAIEWRGGEIDDRQADRLLAEIGACLDQAAVTKELVP